MTSPLHKAARLLQRGKIAVIPTDTIYGLVCSALEPETVEKIYQLRKRQPSKPFIILVSSIKDLNLFNVEPDEITLQKLQEIWPNPVSVILACPESKFQYLHRGSKSLAFRMPKNEFLQKLLKETGPLVAPSANFEGEKPAETIKEARKYFGDQVLYIDGGKLAGKSSTLLDLTGSKPKVVRQGVFLLK